MTRSEADYPINFNLPRSGAPHIFCLRNIGPLRPSSSFTFLTHCLLPPPRRSREQGLLHILMHIPSIILNASDSPQPLLAYTGDLRGRLRLGACISSRWAPITLDAHEVVTILVLCLGDILFIFLCFCRNELEFQGKITIILKKKTRTTNINNNDNNITMINNTRTDTVCVFCSSPMFALFQAEK